MRPEPRKKIPVNQVQTGLNAAFANLSTEGLPAGPPAAPPPAASSPAKKKRGRVVLRRETAHRGGKVVIVIDDFASGISLSEIEELGRKLRAACGCGGTFRERTIEIQGEHVTKLRALLEEEGFQVAGER